MNNTQHFTDDNFQNEVLNSDQTVLVDFWATWCPPCRAIGPTIDQLAADFEGSAKVGKLNVDENRQSAAGFQISSISAVLVFKDGQVVETLLGAQTKARYEEALRNAAA